MRARFLLCATLTLTLAGCALGPNFKHPAVAPDAGYTRQPLAQTHSAKAPGGEAQHLTLGEDIPAEWWQLFGSAKLDALVEEALRNNPDIASAQASLRQAQQLYRADHATLFPSVSGNFSETRQNAEFFGPPPVLFSLASASLNVSYSPDLFGGSRRGLELARAQTEYQRFALRATNLTLTANVVNTAISLASLRDQITTTQSVVQSLSSELALIKARRDLGALSDVDVLAQQASLAQVRATLPPLRKAQQAALDQMAALLGRLPNRDPVEHFDLASLHLPTDLPVSLPSELVRQRPDLRAAEAQWHQASANIGIAQAARLPGFTLTGQYGTDASSISNLFAPGSGIWSIGGAITQPLFDAGALLHRKQAAVAEYDAAAAHYRSTLVGAFQDVANALHALDYDADTLQEEADAERAAQQSLSLTQQQYRMGAISYVNLLTAQQSYQSASLARVRAEANRYSDTVALFQALGGGWWNAEHAQSDHSKSTVTPQP